MTEYIRVSDLNECETCRHHRTGSCDTWCDYGEAYQIDWSKVKKVDAVEVVRCKDCKYWHMFKEDFYACRNVNGTNNYGDEDGFCSCGERKEDAVD